jgi:hypothetical protein
VDSLVSLFFVNNKQNLFNLNGNDGIDILNFNFKEILTARITHGGGIKSVQCPVEAIVWNTDFNLCSVINDA